MSKGWKIVLACAVLRGGMASAEEKMPGVQRMIGAGFEVEGVIPEMRSMLVGLGHPISYRAEVDPKRGYVVVLGSFESEFGRPGIRVMNARIEGAKDQKIDVIESVGWKKPFVTAIEGKDADGDGWLDIRVEPHKDGTHPAPQLTALWIFDRVDWDAKHMTAEQVMEGRFDGFVHHFVDCGTDASFYPSLTHEQRMAPIRAMTEGLESIAANHRKIRKRLGGELKANRKTFQRLEKLLDRKKFDAFAPAFNAYATHLAKVRDQVAGVLAGQYGSFWQRPAETRIASPWGGEVQIRQEDTLRIKIGMLPRVTSNAHTFHPPYAVRQPFDWIEVKTSAPARQESTDLGLDYDLGLQGFEYDPLNPRYTYRDGKVSIQTMDLAGIRVAGEGLKLEVALNVPDLQTDGALVWRKVMSIHDTPIFAGIVFQGLESPQDAGGTKAVSQASSLPAGGQSFECRGFTIVWADSLKELKTLGAHMADWDASRKQTEEWIADRMSSARLTGNPKLVERAEIDKRTLLSMVHPYGGIYASLDAGYNAVWVRDTTIVALFAALAGDPEQLRAWAPYLIANPTPLEHEGRVYRSFIINPYDGKHVFKEEDDGPFYAIASAYGYWKLLDDDRMLMQWYGTLKDSMEFLEVHSFKPETGLYAEYLINEAPLKGSKYWKDEKVESMKLDGDWPLYMQSIYLNNLMYASNLMMGEIAKKVGRTEDSARFFERADLLAKKVDELLWREERGCYLGGLATMDDGRVLDAPWSYYNIMIDYPWALGLYPMNPNSRHALRSINNNVQTVNAEKMTGLYFSASYGHAASIYGWSARYADSVKLLDFMADYCMNEEWSDDLKALYAMKGSMTEVTHTAKFHRPQTFAAAPVMHGIVSLGVSIDFNGINVVPSGQMKKVEGIRFRNGVYDIDLAPVKNLGGIEVDGRAVPGTLKLPAKFYDGGRHEVKLLNKGPQDAGGTEVASQAARRPGAPLLMHTNLELLCADGAKCTVNGYGNGTLRFTGVEGLQPHITDSNGQPVAFKQSSDETGTYLQVSATGQPLVVAWE